MTILLKGGLVVAPGGGAVVDVLVEKGRVTGLGPNLEATADKVIDCSGMWVGPGFVDIHVHFREPGQEWKEDIATGSMSAAAGGFTTVVAMPNTDPPVDSGHLARYVHDRGEAAGKARVLAAGCVTLAREGRKLAHLDDLRNAGVHMFTDDGDTVADAGLLRRAMEYVGDIGGVIAQHAEDPGLARGGHMHEGEVSSRLGMVGLPSMAEEAVVARDLRLVELTGCPYHVQHVSTAGTARLVAAAKAEGLPVTAEVAPHHLVFDHRLVESMDSVAKMYPPLRTRDDIDALKDALRDGTIDAIATDHAPHSAHEKDVPFEEAPRGVIGLETAAGAVNTSVELEPEAFFDRLSVGPAQIAGIETGWLELGSQADIAVFDPDRQWSPTKFRSKSSNSPWVGQTLTGRVVATMYRGELTYELDEEDGE